MRRPLVVGNWKLHGTSAQAQALVTNLLPRLDEIVLPEVVVCPPATALMAVSALLRAAPIRLGAQDVFWEEEGAWTGQVSPMMLAEFDCKFVIVGHSERRGRMADRAGLTDALRASFCDNDQVVNRKLRAVLGASMSPICCVGETQSERDAGRTDQVVIDQIEQATQGVSADDAQRLVFAYEPVWAIGTGQTCSPSDASRLAGVIRSAIRDILGAQAGNDARILYGGGVTGENAMQILNQPDIDGALLGGASLKAEEFASIAASVLPTAAL